MKIRKALKDRRIKDTHSFSDHERETRKNLLLNKAGNTVFACICGCRKFNLLQSKENVKTICTKCEETTIVYWNGVSSTDSSQGSMRRLDTLLWIKK